MHQPPISKEELIVLEVLLAKLDRSRHELIFFCNPKNVDTTTTSPMVTLEYVRKLKKELFGSDDDE